MQEFLEYIVKKLVDHPDAVQVSAVENESNTVYELRLDPDDVGKVIGRKGNTINALRTLLQVGGAKRGHRCTVEIVEDDGL